METINYSKNGCEKVVMTSWLTTCEVQRRRDVEFKAFFRVKHLNLNVYVWGCVV